MVPFGKGYLVTRAVSRQFYYHAIQVLPARGLRIRVFLSDRGPVYEMCRSGYSFFRMVVSVFGFDFSVGSGPILFLTPKSKFLLKLNFFSITIDRIRFFLRSGSGSATRLPTKNRYNYSRELYCKGLFQSKNVIFVVFETVFKWNQSNMYLKCQQIIKDQVLNILFIKVSCKWGIPDVSIPTLFFWGGGSSHGTCFASNLHNCTGCSMVLL